MKRKKIDILSHSDTVMEALKKGIFLTTKVGDKVNSMVIEWGHIGRIWNRPVFVVYVRANRYTRELLDKNPEFTINIPIHGFDKNARIICGTKSGRDIDKIGEAGLTLVDPEVVSVPAIMEFPLTLECKVIYRQEQEASLLSDEIRERFYLRETGDRIAYYGEIVDAYVLTDDAKENELEMTDLFKVPEGIGYSLTFDHYQNVQHPMTPEMCQTLIAAESRLGTGMGFAVLSDTVVMEIYPKEYSSDNMKQLITDKCRELLEDNPSFSYDKIGANAGGMRMRDRFVRVVWKAEPESEPSIKELLAYRKEILDACKRYLETGIVYGIAIGNESWIG